MPGSLPAPSTPARRDNRKPGRSCSENPGGAGATHRAPHGLGAALRAACARGRDQELRRAGPARACQPGTGLPNRAAALVSADDSRSSVVLAASYFWPRSHSPAAAPVRGRSIGLAKTDRPLEGAPGEDVGYSTPSLALRIEKPRERNLFGERTWLNICSLARGVCLPFCHEF